jgi:Protein of unknown function (DUF1488)
MRHTSCSHEPCREPTRAYLPSIDSVVFFADAGSHRQRCLIERATLLLYFGACDTALDLAADSLRAFDGFASLIMAVARELIRTSGGAMCEALVVTADAVFGHVTRSAIARLPRRAPRLALVEAA